MNRIFATLIFALALVLGSCGSQPTTTTPVDSTPTVPDYTVTANTIHAVTQTTVSFGLTVYGGKDAVEAKAAATQIQTIVAGSILPYLNGSPGVSTAVLNTALKENFINLPQAAQEIITLAGALLDQYLPVPSATTFLSDAQLAYAKAFFNGLSDGAGQYLGTKVAIRNVERATLPASGGNWLNLLTK